MEVQSGSISSWVAPPSPHRADAPAVEVTDLSVSFNGIQALDGVTFQVEPGERVAVVGPNGAGKTTLIQVIAGILPPDQGRVQVFGHNPGGHVCIAYVPQRSRVDWNFPVNVADVVMMGRIRKIGLFHWPTRADWTFVREAMDLVGIRQLADRQIAELSGGQQQRVFLAQALAQEAELILLDEPLNGLDIPSQEAIFSILEALQSRGIPVLIATHDLSLAAERFERVMVLNRRMMAYGRPQQALSSQVLVEAYGGHVHRIADEEGLLLMDTCCEGEEGEEAHG